MKTSIFLAFWGVLFAVFPGANAQGATLTIVQYNLVGVTLSDGGTITGSFDWAYGSGVYEFTNINLVARGGGDDLGDVVTVTDGTDALNGGGECLSINNTTPFGCSPLTEPGILLNFVTRLGPNAVFPNEPVQPAVTLCTAAADDCGLATGYDGVVATPSQVMFGADPDVTGGELLAAREPGSLLLTVPGIVLLAFAAKRLNRKRRQDFVFDQGRVR